MLETANAQTVRIRAAVMAIPRGRVASYGEIAARAGLPGRARMVGRVLRETPAALGLPWHRVLRADGCIALAEDGAGYRLQCKRLREEGVSICNGRVALGQYGLRHDIDCELWGLDAGPFAPNLAAPGRSRNRGHLA